MKKTFYKNLLRDITKTLSRFLSIVVIIAIGVAFYAGVRATSPDMKLSGDYYFNKNNLMDFKLISNIGITKEDISEIKKVKGVTAAEGSYSVDGVIIKNKASLVVNINSIPEKNGINQISIISGREPRNNNEAVAEKNFLDKNGYKIGDIITIESGNDSDIRDTLNKNQLKIVGSAYSPLYMSEQRQLSSVGNGSVKGFIYILPSNFKNDVFTEAYVSCESINSLTSLINNDAYKTEMAGIEDSLKKLLKERGEIRYDNVIQLGWDKIKDAENKLSSSKTAAENKLSQGKVSLADGKAKLISGFNDLDKNMADFQVEKVQAQVEISNAKASLDKSEIDLNTGKSSAYKNICAGLEGKIQQLKSSVAGAQGNTALVHQYNALNQIYNNDIKFRDFDSMYQALKADGALSTISSYFDIESMKNTFDKSDRAIKNGRNNIASKEAQLSEGEMSLDAAALKLSVLEAELATNEIALKNQEIDAMSSFSAAENTLEINKDKLSDIKKPEVYVLDRSENVGYESYRQDSDRIDNIGKAFPLIFFLVSALVSLTTMTRMVQENRIEIGTLKALGYCRLTIVSHYLIYALSASLIGSLIGIGLGFNIFPPMIMNSYSSLYTIPYVVSPLNVSLAIKASLIAILFTTVASVAATLEELREVPASLMRPKPPKSGKKILLERIGFIWSRMSFTKKVTARNILRYKPRFFMTVIGIAACTGLIITGFSLKGAIRGSTDNQFNKIYKYNFQANLAKDVDDSEKSIIAGKTSKDSNIDSILFAYTKNASAKNELKSTQDAHIVVPEKKGELQEYIDLEYKGNPVKLGDDGVILTEKFSKLINKKIGDNFQLTVDDKTVNVTVAGITEHYIQHYIYMSPEYYKKVTGEKLEYNSFYGLLKNIDSESENSTSKTLSGISRINSFSFKNIVFTDFQKTMKSIDSVVLLLIVSAGVLAFVVIFNLTNININERKRELATIKLLGFYNSELAAYIYRENVILTLIGCITGIGMGMVLTSFVINTAETNILMFYRGTYPLYYTYSVILTMIFSIIVNLAMYKRFESIDMIESLKSAE
ncbi:MAG: FtsX-like permease family protein [Solirubrobacterales bacterium]